MRLLATTPFQILLVDPDRGGSEVLRSGDGYYYGITSGGGNLVMSHSFGYLQYPGARLRHTTPLCTTQPHLVLWVEEHVLVANTGGNCVSAFDDKGRLLRHVHLSDVLYDDKNKSRSGNHFNSLFWDGRVVYLVAHNDERPSELWELSWPDLDVSQIHQGTACWAHNVWPRGAWAGDL